MTFSKSSANPPATPGDQFDAAAFHEPVKELTDLVAEMALEGVVTNVTKFGAFVDVGVHQDGLVHISELSNRYAEGPGEVVRSVRSSRFASSVSTSNPSASRSR